MDLWETTEAKEFGESERLELGGHELVILDAREYKSEVTGNTSLKISVDVAGNDKQKGFFQKQYDNNTSPEKKWSNGAIKYLSLKDEQLGYLKGFITALEKSNPNFKFNTKGTWEQLKKLKIAAQFGLEEYEKKDGSVGATTKLVQFRSLDKLNEIKIPKVKLLNGEMIEHEKYQKRNSNDELNELFGDAVVEISSDNLPF
jgi:hypothetical protein